MGTHWHFVVLPKEDGDLTAFFRWLTHAHAMPWPVDRPANWVRRVNQPIDDEELDRLRACVNRNQPLGSEAWTRKTVARLHLEHSLRREGRPSTEKGH